MSAAENNQAAEVRSLENDGTEQCNHVDRCAESAGPAGSGQPSTRPACFVITHSVSKRHNVGTIARCATAFGVKEVCLVGSQHFNAFGSHGSDAYVDFRHFPSLETCCKHLKEVEGCEIVGIEILDKAQPVHLHPFKGATAFMLGNEGQGMTDRQMALCDSFVYIPQHGIGTASLNVAVAASIVLHHFAIWAEYPERHREGAKFVVAERPVRTRARGVACNDPDEACEYVLWCLMLTSVSCLSRQAYLVCMEPLRREREERRKQRAQDNEDDDAAAFGSLFEQDEPHSSTDDADVQS